MNKIFVLSVYVCFIFVVIKCDEENCDKLGTLFYEDIGCKAIIPAGKKCPTHYECGSLSNTKDSCIFRGKKYGIKEQFDNNVTYASCNVGCHCREGHDEKATVLCGVLDCPEWLGSPLKAPGCYRTYTPGECCSSGQICPPFDNITKCTVDGKEYKEGERFEPKDTCLECVCMKGFAGKLEEPFCKRQVCAAQIRGSKYLEKYCAPVGFPNGEARCCNHGLWACPSSNDEIKQMRTTTTSENLVCKWGEKTLKIGEGLETTTKHFSDELIPVKCECQLPPFLSCVRKDEN